jgi:hypothetical protein
VIIELLLRYPKSPENARGIKFALQREENAGSDPFPGGVYTSTHAYTQYFYCPSIRPALIQWPQASLLKERIPSDAMPEL